MQPTEKTGPQQTIPLPRRKRRGRKGRWLAVPACLLFLVGGIWISLWWQEGLLRQGDALFQEDKYDAALSSVDEFLKSNPQHSAAIALKARILVEMGQSRQAIQLFEKVGASEREDLHAWAKALLQIEQWSTALPLLEFLNKSGKVDADVLHELAACRAKIGDFDGAVSAAQKFSEMPGCESRGNLLQGTIQNERGNLRLAAAAWDRVLKASPDGKDLQIPPEEFFLEYGRVLLGMGEPALAKELIGKSLEIKPESGTRLSYAEAQFQLGNSIEAKQAFEAVLAENQLSIAARKGLATIAMADGNATEALKILEPLKNTDFISSEIAFLFQRAYVRLNETDQAATWRENADRLRREENARTAADQLLRDTPNSSWAQVIRAYKFAMAGNWEQADLMLVGIDEKAREQSFIQELCDAVKNRTKLPSLEKLPLRDL